MRMTRSPLRLTSNENRIATYEESTTTNPTGSLAMYLKKLLYRITYSTILRASTTAGVRGVKAEEGAGTVIKWGVRPLQCRRPCSNGQWLP